MGDALDEIPLFNSPIFDKLWQHCRGCFELSATKPDYLIDLMYKYSAEGVEEMLPNPELYLVRCAAGQKFIDEVSFLEASNASKAIVLLRKFTLSVIRRMELAQIFDDAFEEELKAF